MSQRLRRALQGSRPAYAFTTCCALLSSIYAFSQQFFPDPSSIATQGPIVSASRSALLSESAILLLSGVMVSTLAERREKTWLALFQFAVFLWTALTLMGFAFFDTTGSHLTWSLFMYGATRLLDFAQVILSEFNTTSLSSIVILTSVWVVLPWLVWARAKTQRSRSPTSKARSGKNYRSVLLITAAIAALGFSRISAIHSPDRHGQARTPTGVLLRTALNVQDSSKTLSSLDTEEVIFEPTDAAVPLRKSAVEGPDNVAIIILESTNFEATSLSPKGPETTPNLKMLSQKGLSATNAYAMVPNTSKSMITILCGIPPYPQLRVVGAQPGRIPVTCLPELLKAQGFRTGFFQTATPDYQSRETLVSNFGFEKFVSLDDIEADNYERVNYFGVEDKAMLPASRQWLTKNSTEPFFAAYLTLATHHDYGENAVETQVQYTSNDRENDYLNALRSVDNFLGDLIEQYRDIGIFSDTLFVIVGDHGQAFGEHEHNFHGGVVYDEGIRVPLVFFGADQLAELQRIDSPISTLSIVPTVLDILGYSAPADTYTAESLLSGETSRPVFFQTHYSSAVGMRSGPLKYIKYGPTSSAELYNLEQDPSESVNLADQMPGVAAHFGTESRLYWERVEKSWNLSHQQSSGQ